jgi:hypothetical protein
LAYQNASSIAGQVGLSAGTAALPSLVAATDTDTGVWFPAANTLAFSTGGSERVRMVTDGLQMVKSIGLGNTAPNSSGVGITFPATQSASSDANTLDDYEEGTFTPTAFGGTTAGSTTYSAQYGFYTKVGRLVTVSFRVAYSALTGTGALKLGGLPFASGSSGNNFSIGTVLADGLNWSAGSQIISLINTNVSAIDIYCQADDAAITQQQCVNEGADIYVTITYFTA